MNQVFYQLWRFDIFFLKILIPMERETFLFQFNWNIWILMPLAIPFQCRSCHLKHFFRLLTMAMRSTQLPCLWGLEALP